MKKGKLVTIKAPAGSIVIPPHKIRETFHKMFSSGYLSGLKSEANEAPFKKSLNEILESFSKIKPS